MPRVLVHDDGQTHSELLERHLSEQHETKFVSTVGDVVAALEGEQFEALLVNIHRQNDVIFSVLEQLQDKLPALNVICLRGPDAPPMAGFDDAYFMALIIAGARGYITCGDYSEVGVKLEEVLPRLAEPEQPEALIA